MNKIVKHIGIILILITVFLFSCSEGLDIASFEPETPVYSFNTDEIAITKDGGEFSLNVKSNLPWRARSNTDWITLTSENGLSDGAFTFIVSRNRTIEQRIGEIIVWVTDKDQKSIKVIQAPSEASDLINHYYVKTTGTDDNDGLSWATSTTLSNALDLMASGDYIHIAAGNYIPFNMVSGGSLNGDKTFEIHSNVTIIGGYPADANEGAVSDPAYHETILSGSKEFYHTVTVTAPVETDKRVTLQNLSIKDGRTGTSSEGTLSINGATYRRSYAGGLIVGKSIVDVIGCMISDNESQQHAAGVYVFDGAIVRFIDSDITNNKGILEASNGGGIYNESATVYLINCNVTENSVWGVGGGIYSYSANTPTYIYLYNTTVANNSTNAGPVTTRRGGGFYVREFSRVQIVNSTFFNNQAGHGAGISIYGVAGREASVTMISSTIFNNNAINNVGGVEVLANTSLKTYNSVISGNTASTNPDIHSAANTTTHSYMVMGSRILDATGATVDGQTFDPATMLGNLEDNGGRTKTCMLQASSPAVIFGMTSALLESLASELNPVISTDIITKDQIGKSRADKTVMGAVVPK